MNILSFFVHEGWESNWAKTNNTFFMLNSAERKEGWKDREREIPKNYNAITIEEAKKMCGSGEIDIIINHSAFGQRDIAMLLTNKFDIKRIEMNHCLPLKEWGKDAILSLKAKNNADMTIFTTEYQRKAWGYGNGSDTAICGHTVDTDMFKHKYIGGNDFSISVAYDFKERSDVLGYQEWKFLTNGINHIHYGNGDGEILANCDMLSNDIYVNNRLFINTAKRSTLPTAMLEAMACGMPVVSVYSEAFTDDIFINEINGLVSKDIFKLKDYIKKLLKDKNFSDTIGKEGYKTFCCKFSTDKFIRNWENILNTVKDK